MILVREGEWWIENVQVGTGSTRQRRGVMAVGPAQITLKDVTFRTRSHSDAAIYADRGGLILLRGAIRINEHLHQNAPDDSFSGIIATDHATVRFDETQGASLDIGNGSLSASYYGCIGLGCKTAKITSWGEQTNTLAINNGGRIDLHNTTTTVCAKHKRNTPIGLEHDGHILAEDATSSLRAKTTRPSRCKKPVHSRATTLNCEARLERPYGRPAAPCSLAHFLTDITDISANTSARINIESMGGKIRGTATAKRCGTISLPDRNIVGE